jgi:hypothetical protein
MYWALVRILQDLSQRDQLARKDLQALS